MVERQQLTEKTGERLRLRFDREMPVSLPPLLLLETAEKAHQTGWDFFEPIYFPAMELRRDMEYPSGWVRLGDWYWRMLKEGKVAKEAALLKGCWALLDVSHRPSYKMMARQMFKGDGRVGLLLAEGRRLGKIAVVEAYKNLPAASRFAVSADALDEFVFPQLAALLQLSDKLASGTVEVRVPTAAEFNFAGNLSYRHFGRADTWEWFDDVFEDKYRLLGGSAPLGGLADVRYFRSDKPTSTIAFRFLIVVK